MKSTIGREQSSSAVNPRVSLPGWVQILEVAVESRRADQVEGEGVMPLEPRLQGTSLVDEPPEQATDGEIGAAQWPEMAREAELLRDDRR